jgi:predicted metal-binding membrane protein
VKAVTHRSVFVPVITSLIVVAWATLWAWEQSPYGRYLNHGELGGVHVADVTGLVVTAAVYVGGWTLMTVAMMLPTTLPLLEIFRRLTVRRPNHDRLVVLLIVGYLAAWMAFGVGAHIFDWFLHALFERVSWLQANPWLFGAMPLILAGAFQFTRLKYRCLDKCRAPLSFVTQYWRRQGGPAAALMLGVRHGAFCVGCCWALMLLMFAIGTGSVGWMLALGMVMAIEKNLPWGRRLSPVLGIGLLAWGGSIVVNQSWAWNV